MENTMPNPINGKVGENRLVLCRALFFTFLLGLAAHGFQYLHLDPSHDYLMRLTLNTAVEGPVSRGRFLEPVYNLIMGPASTLPWSAGLISLLWLGLTVYAAARLFDLSGRKELFLLAAVLVVNRSMISLNAVYLPFAGVFSLSALTAVLAVYCWKKSSERRWYLGVGALLTAASLAMYQSYLFTSVTLILLYSFYRLLKHDRAAAVIVNGLKSVAMLLVGCGIYMVSIRAACRVTGIPLAEGDYNSLSNLWGNSESILDRLTACYTEVWENLIVHPVSIWSGEAATALALALCAVTAVLLVLAVLREKIALPEQIVGLLILLVLPLGANGIRLLNNECHDLMHYAFWLLLLLPVLLLSVLGGKSVAAAKWSGAAACLLLCVLTFSNLQLANLTYTQKEQEFEATRAVMINVMERVEEQEGYVEGETPVAFLGTPESVLRPLKDKDKTDRITGCYASSAISYYHTYFSYFENVLQRNTNVVLVSDELQSSPEAVAMPAYPARGCVAAVDGTVVVKF